MNDEVLREPPPVVRRARHAFRKLSAGTRPLVYSGNRIELLRNGEQYFPRLLAAIDSATQSIYIETYTFELDNIGEKSAVRYGGRAPWRCGTCSYRRVRLANDGRPVD